jgi:hypothetical protein
MSLPTNALPATGPNWVLFLTIALPAVAVIASFTSLALVLHGQDSELPEQFHWEGARLESDYLHAAAASALQVRARLSVNSAEHLCRLSFASDGQPPPTLVLTLTHATLSRLDQRVTLQRTADGGYEGACEVPPAAHWQIELSDAPRSWSVREVAGGSLDALAIDAGPPPGARAGAS